MNRRILLITTLLMALSFTGRLPAQEIAPERLVMVYPAIGFQFPGGDLADRFGFNSTVGPGIQLKTRSNWVFTADINFLFGNRIREENLIQNLLNHDGFVINDEGRVADISFFQRGFYTSFRIGKVIPVFGSNPNSGLLINAGGGFMQHNIHIKVEDNLASALKGDYKKGYDRLTNGFSTTQFIGYMHVGSSNLANFFAGFEFVQAWTQNRRSMNFDTMQRDDRERFDALYGFKAGWIIPFRKRAARDFYYY